MRLSLRIYIGVVAVVAALSVMRDPLSWISFATGWQILLVVALIALGAVGERISFEVHSGWTTHAGTIPHIATALLLPPGLAGAVAGLGTLAYVLDRRWSVARAVFNVAIVVLGVDAASYTAHQLIGTAALIDQGGWRGFVAAGMASMAYYVVTVISMVLVVALDQRRSIFSVLRGKVGAKTLTDFGLGLLGGILAVLLSAAPWFAPALGIPALLSFLAKRALDRAANHARDLALTSKVGRAVAGTLSMDLAFDAITAREVRDALRLEGLALLSISDPPDFPARVAADRDFPAVRLGLVRRLAAAPAVIHLGGRDQFPADWIESLEPNRSIAAAAVPCNVGTTPMGALVAWRSTDSVEGFGADELLLLETLADYAAVAFQNAHLFEEALSGRATAEERESRVQAVMDNVADGLLTFDEHGRIDGCNPAAERIFGEPAQTLAGLEIAQLLPGIGTQAGVHHDITARHVDGGSVSVEVAVTAIPHSDPPRLIAVVHDVSERKAFEEQLRHMAFHDHLTGLPNRALFMDRVEHALGRADSNGRSIAVLFIDVDNFKVVNDSLGHAVGDRLLILLTTRLRAGLDAQATLARFGGDEFTVLLEDLSSPADAENEAQRIRDVLRRPISVAERDVFASVSVGIAISAPGQDTPGDLVRNADIAMYRAKANGRGRSIIFDRSLDALAVGRLQLETELRSAVDRQELEVHYQPIVDLRSGRIKDVEALVRWRHPEHGLIPPDRFIPVAEDTGLIIPIGQHVLETACAQIRSWEMELDSCSELAVSVNLSARQFQRTALVDDIARVLHETRLPPHRLMLEITESIAMRDATATADILARLKDLGVRLAIDDFGTGYSSLSYLHRFPIDVLKIDRSFISRLTAGPHDAAIVEAVIALARGLNMKVTAEGIETNEQLIRLQALGCDRGQGYYFARPMPAGSLVEVLADEPDDADADMALAA